MNSFRRSQYENLIRDEWQRSAYGMTGSSTVIAGPGSGKTTVLTHKALRILEGEVTPPQGVACITYNREAAKNIRARIAKLGGIDLNNLFVGTVHSFCISQVLSVFGSSYGHFSVPPKIRIASQREINSAFRSAIEKLGLVGIRVSMEEMNRERKNTLLGLSLVEAPVYDIALNLAKAYEVELHNGGVIDFEDVVNYSTILVQKENYVRKCIAARFPYVLIDEYQDFGRPLHELTLALLENTNIKIHAYGDPDQSIYGFQGANPNFLHELSRHQKMECVSLENNYRSDQQIIYAFEAVIGNPKGYKSTASCSKPAEFLFHVCTAEMNEQYELVANSIIPKLVRDGISLDQICVLVGSNSETQEQARFLESAKIPHYLIRHPFERSDFVQWLEDCAKWIMKTGKEVTFAEISDKWAKFSASIGTNNINGIHAKAQLLAILNLSKSYSQTLASWLHYLIDELNIDQILSGISDAPDEIQNIELLIQSAEDADNKMTLDSFSNLGKPNNQVTVSTRHSAKGLEFEAVIILGMEHERFPSYRALTDHSRMAEEERICYVSVSRAKRVCILIRSNFHTIPTRNGPWRKSYNPSIFWQRLENWHNTQKEILPF